MKSKLIFALAICLCASSLALRAQDTTPPVVLDKFPVPGALPDLTQIDILFSEPVIGVDAGDLLINSVPATFVSGSNDLYTFRFPRPAPNGGPVHVSWSVSHGITDLAANSFDGTALSAQWDYQVPDATPVVAVATPPPGFVTDLTQVTVQFSEPVSGVDASDFLVNSRPANSVVGGGDTYTFFFPRPNTNGGAVHISWSETNGIVDSVTNAFVGVANEWDYQLADIAAPVVIEMRPGTNGRPLMGVQVIFNEPVLGVTPGDLLLNGVAAANLTTQSMVKYTFEFAPAPPGRQTLSWSPGNGITDFATVPNHFIAITNFVFETRNYSIFLSPVANIAYVTFSNRFFNGVCTVESRENRKWVPVQNFFTTQRVGQVTLALPTNNYSDLRLRGLDVSPGNAFTHLALAYGDLGTVAGKDSIPPGSNAWLAAYEGADATTVNLSNPRRAIGDAAGNIYVVERDGHAVDRITPDGKIHTLMGIHMAGFTPSNVSLVATSAPLHSPSSLWLAGDFLCVLDAGNSRVSFMRLMDGLPLMNTLFTDFSGIDTNTAGPLWVGLNKDNLPNEAFYGVGRELRHWDKGEISVLTSNFLSIGDIVVNPDGDLIVADPLDHRIFEVKKTGNKKVIGGTGFPHGPMVGDLDEVALAGPSSFAYLPIGGLFVGLDEGARVWYADAKDNAVPFVFGASGAHDGDGAWFRAGRRRPKISNVRSVSLSGNGDILILESGGLIRRIQFLRHSP